MLTRQQIHWARQHIDQSITDLHDGSILVDDNHTDGHQATLRFDDFEELYIWAGY